MVQILCFHQHGQTYHLQSFGTIQSVQRNGWCVPYIASILIHNQVNYPLIVQAPYMVHISIIIFYEKSIKYPFFHHFDFRNGFYRSELVSMQHLGVAVGAEVADHRHWNALTSLIFAEWGLLLSLDNG